MISTGGYTGEIAPMPMTTIPYRILNSKVGRCKFDNAALRKRGPIFLEATPLAAFLYYYVAISVLPIEEISSVTEVPRYVDLIRKLL